MKFTLTNISLIVFSLLCLWLLIKFCYKRYLNYLDYASNKYDLDKTEFPENIDYRTTEYFMDQDKNNQLVYIFWSGGFSSTFRLCQLLLIEEKSVQPIYIHTQNFGKYQKKNEMEIIAMKKIRNQIIKDYPFLKTRFAPTMYFKSLQKEPSITKKFNKLHEEFGYFEFNADKDKYENIARLSHTFIDNLNKTKENKNRDYEQIKYIELPIDKSEFHLQSALSPYLESDFEQKRKLKIDIPVGLQNLHIFNKCLFPILHLNRDQLKLIAINNNFYYLLKLTWSCSNPNSKNNNLPCYDCFNCQNRPI